LSALPRWTTGCFERLDSRQRAPRRFLTVVAALIFFLDGSHALCATSHELWDGLVRAHAAHGRVNYAGFLADRAALDQYLTQQDGVPVESFADSSREERMAAWINVYNASVIRLILAHYPVASVDEIPRFWDERSVGLAHLRYSLRQVRDGVFIQGFRDERALLALVSGTGSSPPLREEAYVGDRLLEQLRDQVRIFLTDERYNRVAPGAKKIYLSPFFRDHARSFVLGYGRLEQDGKFSPEEYSVLSFIRLHVEDTETKRWIEARRYKLVYLKEDRRLNDTGETPV
jgi:hypothetical protein